MKLIILACLLGFAAASILKEDVRAVDGTSDDYQLDRIERSISGEIADIVRGILNRILEKIKENLAKGKEISQELLDWLKESIAKIKERNIELGEKIKELIKKIREGANEKLRKILDQIMEKDSTGEDDTSDAYYLDRIERVAMTDVMDRLREIANGLITKFLENVEKGKELNERLIAKLREIIEKLKERGLDLKEKIIEKLKNMKGITEEKMKKIKDKLFKKKEARALDDMSHIYRIERSIFDDFIQVLQNHFNKFMDAMIVGMQKGKEMNADFMTGLSKVAQALDKFGVDVRTKLREALEKVAGITKEKIKKIMDAVLGKKDARALNEMSNAYRIERDIAKDIIDMLQKYFDKFMNKVIVSVEKGKEIADDVMDVVRKIIKRLEEIGMDMKTKVHEKLKKITGMSKEKMNEIMDKIFGKDDTRALDEMPNVYRTESEVDEEMKDILMKRINNLMERVVDRLKKGMEIPSILVTGIQRVAKLLLDHGVDIRNKMHEMLKEVKGISVETIKEILDKLLGKKDARALDDMSDTSRIERGVREELIQMMKEDVERILAKIIKLAKKGEEIKSIIINSCRTLINLLKDRGVDMKDEIHQMLKDVEEIKEETVKEIMKKLYPDDEKRSLHDVIDYVSELKFRDLIEDIKQKVLSNEVVQKIREYIKNFVATNPVIQKMKEAILKLSDFDLRQFIKNLLHLDTSRDRRSIKDLWEKIKEYFKNLNIELKEKWMKFGEWVKEALGKALDKIKEKKEKLKFIAKQLIDHSKELSREVLREGIEFLRPYKDDLGALWDQLKDSVKDVLGKDDQDF